MKDTTSKYMSKVYTGEYLAAMRYKNINHICFSYLGSKVFSETTRKFLVSRWSEMNDTDIINDLMSVNNGEIYNCSFPYSRKYPSIFWIITYNCIEIVPIRIIEQLPVSLWSEGIVDTHGGNDMDKFEVVTLREYLLRKKKTPIEVKDYLK